MKWGLLEVNPNQENDAILLQFFGITLISVKN
jgi:hypothetical protein